LRATGTQAVPSYEEPGGVIQEPPSQDERTLILGVIASSAVDVIVSGIIVGVAFRFAYRDNGVSLYCLGIQGISHILSSLLLGFRFVGELAVTQDEDNDDDTHGLLRKRRRKFLVREQMLCEMMGIVMLLSSCGLLFKAFRKIRFWDEWYKDHINMDAEVEWVTEFLAWYGFAVYLIQTVFRFCAGRRLRRSIIWHAFVASLVSVLFLLVLGIAASYEKEWSWKAEPIAAIGLSFVTLAEGVRIVISYLDDMDDRLREDPRA